VIAKQPANRLFDGAGCLFNRTRYPVFVHDEVSPSLMWRDH